MAGIGRLVIATLFLVAGLFSTAKLMEDNGSMDQMEAYLERLQVQLDKTVGDSLDMTASARIAVLNANLTVDANGTLVTLHLGHRLPTGQWNISDAAWTVDDRPVEVSHLIQEDKDGSMPVFADHTDTWNTTLTDPRTWAVGDTYEIKAVTPDHHPLKWRFEVQEGERGIYLIRV